MLSLIMIHALNQQQAQRAADEQLYPLVVEAEDKQSGDRLVTHLRRIPEPGQSPPRGTDAQRTPLVDVVHQARRGQGVGDVLSRAAEHPPAYAWPPSSSCL